MRLRSSGGYDPNDGAPHRIGDEEHSPVDNADRVETQLVGCIEIIEFDHVRVQEDLRGRAEVDTMLLPVGLLLGVARPRIY